MIKRDWQNPDDYDFLKSASAGQWAWEFLRRNPRYRAQWQAFNETWQALEQAYGRPPKRDFSAWKRDPRAWVPAQDCEQGDCRIDGAKVLIECAIGARWGFHKFPPSPDEDDPVGEERLVWRELHAAARLPESDGATASDPAHVRIEFDLSLPLQDQLTWAKRRLQALQRERVRSGRVKSPAVAGRKQELSLLLRLLDGLEAGADSNELNARLYADSPPILEERIGTAIELRDRGYRQLLLLK